MEILIDSPDEKRLRSELEKSSDPEAARISRFLAMPDLSRTSDNPIAELVKHISGLSIFKGFDKIKAPEIVSTEISFDLFNFSPEHPARSRSDTYFVDNNHILRPHTTVMWYYHLAQPEVKKRLGR